MVKRYEHQDRCGGEYDCRMYECSTGDYVAFVDYEEAINSHELHKKLVAMIKQWQAEEFWNENPKLVMETLWSALKEAENSND